MVEYTIKDVASLIHTSQKFALIAHVNPDPDTLGSMLALGRALKQLGKDYVMLVDDKISDTLSFLPDVEQVKNPRYLSHLAIDLCIVIDASDLERVGYSSKITTAPILNIDHHISNNLFADYLLLDTTAAATGEIIFDLLLELGVDIDIQIATNLYAAIATDCGFFQYANTTAKCMRSAAALIDYGVKPNEVYDNLEIRTLDSVQLLCKVLQTMEFYCNKTIAVISLPKHLYQEGLETEGFIKYPRYLSGVEVAVLCKYVTDTTTRISIRSKNLDVSKVAIEFGGGGHKRASGCTIHADITTAKNLLVETISAALKKEQHK